MESSDVQYKEKYFVESSNKVHYFFENGALDESGNLKVDPSIALNKVSDCKMIWFSSTSP